MYAVVYGSLSCLDLQEILQHEDAKNLLNDSDLDENTPLHVAAKKGFALIVEVGFGRVFVCFFCFFGAGLRYL